MSRHNTPKKGDVYWIDPNPVSGKEMHNKHRFVIITPEEINALGIVMAVPITSAGPFARNMGLTVPISGYDTNGVAVCNQIRSFDILARVKAKTASYVETLDEDLISEIVTRVLSVIEPAIE
ncbi:MAG: type II toxin-antitoxin system PemK/MazF family toxin [Myxococcaceae bacterium]